jgi:membrane-associated phospholipid phosphatase
VLDSVNAEVTATFLTAAATVICVSLPLPARADGLDAGSTDKLALNVPADAAVIALGGIAALVPEIFQAQLGATQCHWCGAGSLDRSFHDFFTGAIFSRQTANTISNVTANGLAPAVALLGVVLAPGPHATEGAGLRGAVIVIEGSLVAVAISQDVKLITARARPFVVYDHPSQPGEKGLYEPGSSSLQSFPSGHSTLAASVGVGAAMTATLEESPAAPWLWASAGVLTVSTGILRMMAEKHWVTDDLAGIGIGAGCGVLFPLLHRRGSLLGGAAPVTPLVAPLPGGAKLGFAGRF